MKRVVVLGVGHSRFGKRTDATVQELAFEAYREAVHDAQVAPTAIDALCVGSVPEYHRQRSLAGAIQDHLGLHPAPTWLCEAACASGSAAIRTGVLAIQSGAHKLVAVVGSQKMTDLGTADILALMGRVGDAQWEAVFGSTFPGYYALFARRHMHEFGTTLEQLGEVPVKNHHYGAMNPLAMYRKPITIKRTMIAPVVASPLRMYDCCSNADGAACLILADETTASNAVGAHPRIILHGSGAASASMSVLRAGDLTGVPSAREAARQAYSQAGVSPKDIHVAQVHDGFSITEIMAYEDLGFCGRGEGGPFVQSRQTYLGGSIPTNVDGGIKAKGHPVGATGVSMAVEIVRQLRGECGDRQVPNAALGLTHNVGGVGQYVFVNIFRRES